ncbi:MAG: 16S rRNA (cytosine(967)-C(5))-methyltransferase RsmB [Burkholderiales bacterium]
MSMKRRSPPNKPRGTATPPIAATDARTATADTAPTLPAGAVRGMVLVQVVASQVVGRVMAGKNLDREIAELLAANPSLTQNERQAVHSICFDTLRHAGLINAQLDVLLSQPLTDPAVRHLLQVALAQLQFSKAAAHAIVDHAVDACEFMGLARAKGLVNAVLRNFLRTPDKFARQRFKDPVATLDHPRWWIQRVRAAYPDSADSLLASAGLHPPMHLRVNARASNPEAYLAQLASAGLSAHALGMDAICVENPIPVSALPGFAEGIVSVQDLGAQLAAHLLAPRTGMRVLDACAAPGGKTGHLLESADIELTALDTDKFRLKRVEENLRRLKLSAHVQQADAAQPSQWWDKRPFDRILLDVPCSGSGVTRRHPDIKWIRRESDIKRFIQTQAKLLDALWPCLAPGGQLLYATCSVFAEENEDVVKAFLASHPDAAEETALPDAARSAVNARSSQNAPGLTLLANEVHDGFYYALIQKKT